MKCHEPKLNSNADLFVIFDKIYYHEKTTHTNDILFVDDSSINLIRESMFAIGACHSIVSIHSENIFSFSSSQKKSVREHRCLPCVLFRTQKIKYHWKKVTTNAFFFVCPFASMPKSIRIETHLDNTVHRSGFVFSRFIYWWNTNFTFSTIDLTNPVFVHIVFFSFQCSALNEHSYYWNICPIVVMSTVDNSAQEDNQQQQQQQVSSSRSSYIHLFAGGWLNSTTKK